ncbi:LytR/AlgR family response regulator transcription factor [Aquimarina muelleri]|uniref:DNA-binding response regulator n=1 Tax=Aquimarina muelleri TaxID=279356 RepID=A0A918JU44_9FLAO|nr:LytTR family DNA-binding domain-containing protein [Aquimarina muelleri]MCX2761240.1 LytTR family DNA-binding domain-containing protein [Aquimarina muelleri]GGX09300.1 DNA-binding response regulator [Aquimarina muelleri]
MTAIIVEDENIASRRLANLIKELAPEIEITGQITSVENGLHWFKNNPLPDLIFLDIQLNDGYGFDILDTLEDHPPVIFTTAYNEYAIRGFKYNGLDYLLKPIDKNDLKNALVKYRKNNTDVHKSIDEYKFEHIKSLFSKEYKRRFMIKIGNQFNTFNVDDIAYFKSHEGVIFLHSHLGKKYPIEYSIDQLEDILNPIHFFRINRKFMVSVKAVIEIHSYFNSRLLLKLNPQNEDQIIVSRERTSNFKKWLDL